MAIKAECPLCHRKQKVSNKVCACGQDLDKAKKSKKVKYHITYSSIFLILDEVLSSFGNLK